MNQPGKAMRICRQLLVAAIALVGTPSSAAPPLSIERARLDPSVDIYALMSGRCTRLRVAGRDFRCRAVAYFHFEHGRAKFTVALDDPADHSHIIAFAGENGKRSQDNLYELPIDRMLLSSKDRPKVDGLPVPSVELSAGLCQQLGNFAAAQVSSISCSATDKSGSTYELQFESDGSPIALRRVRQTTPSIRTDPFN